MDIRNYIQSGIVESYVLGLSTPEETADVEKMAIEYPDVKKAILDFEILFEEQTNENLIKPPTKVKANLTNTLFPEISSKQNSTQVSSTPNIPTTPVRNINTARYLAAASIVLLLISTGLNFYFYSSFKESTGKYQALLNERNTLQANNAAYKTQLDSAQQSMQSLQQNNEEYKNRLAGVEQTFKVMHNPDVKEIKLKGLLDKTNFATVYWNTQTKEVYFFKNHLKETPAGKQYQLWAIVKGKPVSAGVIDVCTGLCKMKIIPDAQAFAVTLEKEGGSTFPTLTTMAVLGKV